MDTAVLGRRERDVRRGFSLPPTIGPGTLLDGALHPAWTWSLVTNEPIRFANVADARLAADLVVDRMLGWFASGMVRSMSLIGAASMPELGREFVDLALSAGGGR